jgi:L-fuculose-phosphate aldolase
MWINSRKASRSTLTVNDVVAVDIATGRQIGSGDPPPSEFHIHREIMRRRPDVGGIVHSHPEFVVALSVAGRKLAPVTGLGSFLPEDVPVFDDANLVNSEERGAAMAEQLGDAPAIVLRAHGIVVVGTNVEDALSKYVCAEENARMQYRASLLGEPHVLRGAELAFVRSDHWTPQVTQKHWNYHEKTAERAGALDGVDG